jgi:hypothetical protein
MAKNRGINIKLKILALLVMLGIVGRVDAVSFFTSSKLLSDCESEIVSVRNEGDGANSIKQYLSQGGIIGAVKT